MGWIPLAIFAGLLVVGEIIETRHPEICTVDFWKAMQDQHEAGELPDFFPYPDELRIPRGVDAAD